jgi:hypothetical protein
MLEEFARRKNINRGFRNINIWKLSIEYYKMIFNVLSANSAIPLKIKAQIEDTA